MDDFIFQSQLASCQSVAEETTCLEILHYSDPVYNSCIENVVGEYELNNFLDRKGQFAEPPSRYNAPVISGLRLVIQKQAKHAETFAPCMISLPAEQYEAMIQKLKLPLRAIEGTTVVGPFFWTSYVDSAEDPRLHIIFRKSDTRKQGKTEGWEVVLSYSPQTGMTTGFVKGTSTAHIPEAIEHFKTFASADQNIHPLLLPIVLLAHGLGSERDRQLRDARDKVRQLEQSISQRRDGTNPNSVKESMSDIEATNHALVECHAQVLRKRPQDWLEIIRGVETAMQVVQERTRPELWTSQMDAVHNSLVGRLDFYKIKLKAVEGYAHTTIERLNIQRNALASIIAHRESIVNLQMVAMITDQRRISQAAKKDGNALKRLSMMGAIFLPGTFLASIFSMVFFRLPEEKAGSGSSERLRVAPELWIYFVIAVPLTVLAVGTLWMWDRKRNKRSKRLTAALEEGLEDMEQDIVLQMKRQNFGGKGTLAPTKSELLDDF